MMFKRTRLRLLAYWRRWRKLDHQRPITALLARADPHLPWLKRVNWLLDLIAWLHHEPFGTPSAERVRFNLKTRRLRVLLDALDRDPVRRAAFVATLQAILREADGLDLFCATGLPREPALVGEIVRTLVGKMLPATPLDGDLDSLFGALFPQAELADWIERIDRKTLARLRPLVLTDALAARYRGNAEDALTYLATVVSATGLDPDVRACMVAPGLRASPFLRLEATIEALLAADADTRAERLATAQTALTVARAAIVDAHLHLTRHGVSVALVYRLTRMRALIKRIDTLLGLLWPGDGQTARVAPFVADLVRGRHMRTSVGGLIARNTALLARQMVAHNAEHGEHYIARNRDEYRDMFVAATGGGLVTAFTTLFKFIITGWHLPKFFEGLAGSINYGASFIVIQLAGFALATKQPAMTAPALADKLEAVHQRGGLRALVEEVVHIARSQSAAVFGNVLSVAPVVVAMSLAIFWVSGHWMIPAEKAHATLASFSLLGWTPVFAAFTGVLLWASSLCAGFADNWFALRRLAPAIAFNRTLQAVVGEKRSGRVADFLQNNIGGFAGNLSLGVLLAFTPLVAEFFGLGLEVRHVTLSTGAMTAAACALGWASLATAQFWLAALGVAAMGLLNVLTCFALALTVAVRASGISEATRHRVYRALRRRMIGSPLALLLPLAERVRGRV